jgi:hypothetical protein
VAAARAANTLKGYRSDWAEWCSWCVQEGSDPLVGEAAAISQYLVFLAGVGDSYIYHRYRSVGLSASGAQLLKTRKRSAR